MTKKEKKKEDKQGKKFFSAIATRLKRVGRHIPNRRGLWRLAISVTSIVFVIALSWAWVAQSRQTIQCHSGPDPREYWKGYVEINLKRQHPTEPSFHGELFFLYVDEAAKAVSSVTVTSSAVGSYAATTQVIDTVWDDSFFHALRPRADNVPFAVVSGSGLHQYFPFDSATFDFTLSAVPRFDQRRLLIINRVPGFVLPCDQLYFSQNAKGDLHVSFALWRSPLIQLFVIVLSLALVVFIVPIVRIKDTGLSQLLSRRISSRRFPSVLSLATRSKHSPHCSTVGFLLFVWEWSYRFSGP